MIVTTRRRSLRSPIDPAVLDSLVQAVPEIWCALHRQSRSPRVTREGQRRLCHVIGAMSVLWGTLLQNGQRKFKNPADRDAKFRAALTGSSARHNIGRDMCGLLVTVASRWAATEAEGDSRASGYLRWAFWRLIGTGVYSQLPNTLREVFIPADTMESVAKCLLGFSAEATRQAQATDTHPHARLLMARVTGLGIFEGVREGSSSPQGLVHWYNSGNTRRQRGFYAALAQGVHELGTVRDELLFAGKDARTQREKQLLRNSRTLIERHLRSLVSTGVLMSVPA